MYEAVDTRVALLKIDGIISQLVPLEIRIVLISPDLAEVGSRLSENRNVLALAVERGEILGFDGLFSESDIDLIVFRYGLETLADPHSCLKVCADRGLPLVCTYFVDQALEAKHEEWAPWRRTIDGDSFKQMADDAGYDIEITMPFPQFVSSLLLPRSNLVNRSWWTGKEGTQFIARRRKRAERLADKTAVVHGSTIWRPSPKWEERAVFIAGLIPKGLHVLDLGCGRMDLERHVGAQPYTPLDQFSHDDRTIVVDMNREVIPEAPVRAADIVTALGVFEYIHDPAPHLRVIAEAGKPLICTYNPAEKRKASAENSALSGWVSHWSTEQFVELLESCRFAVARVIDFGNKQKVFLALPEAAGMRSDRDETLLETLLDLADHAMRNASPSAAAG